MATDPQTLRERFIFPPGPTIADELEARSLAPAALAKFLGWPPDKLSRLLAGDLTLDEPVANQLEAFFGIGAEFWLNKERRYRQRLQEWEVSSDKDAPQVRVP